MHPKEALRGLFLATTLAACSGEADPARAEEPSEVMEYMHDIRGDLTFFLLNVGFVGAHILIARRRQVREVLKGSTLDHVQIAFHKEQDGKLITIKLEARVIRNLLQNQAVASELSRVIRKHAKNSPYKRLIRLDKNVSRHIGRVLQEMMAKESLLELARPGVRIKTEGFWVALCLEPGEDDGRFVLPRLLVVPQSELKKYRKQGTKSPQITTANPYDHDRITSLQEMSQDVSRKSGGTPEDCFQILVPYVDESETEQKI